MREFANSELEKLKNNYQINEKKLNYFTSKDLADSKTPLLKLEQALEALRQFVASDLYKMYEKVSQKRKWTIEVISISKSDAGGLKEIALIKVKIYIHPKYESGVHRVQECQIPKLKVGPYFSCNSCCITRSRGFRY